MSAVRSIGPIVLALLSAAASAPAQQPPAPAPAAPAPPAFEVKVVTTEPVHAVVLPMKGSYEQHQAAFERLAGFLAQRKAAPAGPPFARYFSDPTAGEESLVWEVGFPVAPGVTAEAPFEVKEIPAALSAVHVHKGPLEELGTAWPAFIQWLGANGYAPVGPPTQIFPGDPMVNPQVEMRMPVEKVK